MPNPTLTNLIRHDWITLSAATAEAFHEAFQTALADCTFWELRGSGTDYTEARNTGDLAGFIALFVGSTTTRPDSSQLASPFYYADSNDGKQNIFVGVAPDDSALTGAWTAAANPYGSARWSEFYRTAAPAFTRFRILENAEQLIIVYNNLGTGSRYASIVGAVIKPLSDAGSDETDGRLKGMAVSGSTAISDTFLIDDEAFMSSYRTSNANQQTHPQIGIFLPTNKATFGRIWRISSLDITTTSAGLKDVAGDAPLIKLPYRMFDSPYYFVGYARQIVAIMESLDNQTIRNGAGTLIGYTLANSSTTVHDSIGFINQ